MHIPNTSPLPAGATVWGYLRDSGGDNQDRSVGQQHEILVAYCKQHELVLERVFSDEAKEGSNAEARDGLEDLLLAVRDRFSAIHDLRRRKDAADRRRHGIAIWSLARLGRDAEHLRTFLDEAAAGLDGRLALQQEELDALRKQLEKATRQGQSLVRSIADGLDTDLVREQLFEVEARRRDLADRIVAVEAGLASLREGTPLHRGGRGSARGGGDGGDRKRGPR